jgi:hypothetical protein
MIMSICEAFLKWPGPLMLMCLLKSLHTKLKGFYKCTPHCHMQFKNWSNGLKKNWFSFSCLNFKFATIKLLLVFFLGLRFDVIEVAFKE